MKTNSFLGLAYLTYDAKETLRQKVVDAHNQAQQNRIQEKDYIQQCHVSMIDAMLTSQNRLVQECCYINEVINAAEATNQSGNLNESMINRLNIQLSAKTSVFEVAAATSLESRGR